jgi:hypothetical protein
MAVQALRATFSILLFSIHNIFLGFVADERKEGVAKNEVQGRKSSNPEEVCLGFILLRSCRCMALLSRYLVRTNRSGTHSEAQNSRRNREKQLLKQQSTSGMKCILSCSVSVCGVFGCYFCYALFAISFRVFYTTPKRFS